MLNSVREDEQVFPRYDDWVAFVDVRKIPGKRGIFNIHPISLNTFTLVNTLFRIFEKRIPKFCIPYHE